MTAPLDLAAIRAGCCNYGPVTTIRAFEDEVERLRAERGVFFDEGARLGALVHAMRPVVEAAVALMDIGECESLNGGKAWINLADAVDAYLAQLEQEGA
jgi:hypothetical protein